MAQTETQTFSSDEPLLYRFIRIYPHEFSRVSVLWLFRFLYRFALVIGWTFIVAYFVQQYGDKVLSYLFLVHACIVITGSLIFIRLSRSFSLETLFLGTILLAGILLLLGQIALHNEFWTIFIIFFVETFILIQLSINFDTFVERLFTPLESERTFAIVESADTIAALFGGFFLFYGAAYLDPFILLWVLIGCLFTLIPLLLFYQNFIRLAPGMCMYRKQLLGDVLIASSGGKEESLFKKGYQTAQKHAFTRGLVWVVLAQWATAVLLEFLFTASVSEKVLTDAAGLPATASGVENILIHEFGFLYIFFGAAAFIAQLFLAPRVIVALGIIPSMVIYPVIYLLSMIGLVGSFGFFTSVLTKVNAEITGGIYRNAYQASYYVFEEEESQHVRLTLEGIVRPLGVLLGTFYLLFSRLFITQKFFITAIIFGMFLCVLCFLILTSRLQKRYIQTAISQLFSPNTSENLKLHLVEILNQKGTEEARPIFYKILNDPKTSHLIRIKILELLSDDAEILPSLFEYIQSDDHETRFFALSLLKKIARKGYFSNDRFFSRQVVFQSLKNRYISEHHDQMRSLILEIMALIGGQEVAEFFLETFQNESGQALSNVILAARLFHDEGIFPVLKEFLSSPDARIWASSVVTLSRYKAVRQELIESIWMNVKDSRPLYFLQALRAIRALKEKTFLEYLKSLDITQKNQSDSYFYWVLTLAQLGDPESLKRYIEFLLNSDSVLSERAYHFLSEFSTSLRSSIERHLRKIILNRLHQFLQHHSFKSFREIPNPELKKLRSMYLLLNASEDVLHIDHLLHDRKPSYHPPIILPLYL